MSVLILLTNGMSGENGLREHPLNPLQWAQASQRGAGEIMLTSIDRDGMAIGLDLDLIKIYFLKHIGTINREWRVWCCSTFCRRVQLWCFRSMLLAPFFSS